MTYNKAKKKVLLRWLIGLPILFIASLSSGITILKMFYFGLDRSDQISNAIAQAVQRLVYLVYENTHFLEFFWVHSPTPTLKDAISLGNITSFVIYLFIFVGMGFINSATALSRQIKSVNKEIERELIRDSVRGNTSLRKQEMQEQAAIPQSPFITQLHTLYFAPIIVGLIVALLAKLTSLI